MNEEIIITAYKGKGINRGDVVYEIIYGIGSMDLIHSKETSDNHLIESYGKILASLLNKVELTINLDSSVLKRKGLVISPHTIEGLVQMTELNNHLIEGMIK